MRVLLRLFECLALFARYRVLAVNRPGYWFGMLNAGRLAASLGLDRITAIEFGVAKGGGLLALERIARVVEKRFAVAVDIYGFDTGSGLPASDDYRDLPYVRTESSFKMEREQLAKRLRYSKLLLGDVKDTLPQFMAQEDVAPIGFVSFDFDYYTSTKIALAPFRSIDPDRVLPRMFCYFDDIMSDLTNDLLIECDYVGEMLAIREFNDETPDAKIAPIAGLASKCVFPGLWYEKTFVLHFFKHPSYSRRLCKING